MSYKVRFWSSFAKKTNSTKSPTLTTGTEYDCIVKTETGILNPTVSLAAAATFSPGYSYCYIPVFGRYYWVREWRFEDRLWTADLVVDVMATYRTNIGNKQLYLLRAANDFNTYITDSHYPLLNDTTETITQGTVNSWWTLSSSLNSGVFVVGVRGLVASGQASGGTTYIALSPANFKWFTQTLFDNQMTAFVTGSPLDITDTLAKMIFDPTKYIASCIWLPGTVAATSQTSGINVGWWKFSGTFDIVTPVTYVGFNQRIHIPHHGQQASRGVYMDAPPFTYRSVHLPRFGLVDLSGSLPANAADLVITLDVDPISGQGLYKIYYTETTDSNTTLLIDEIQCQIGVDIPLTSSQMTIQDIASSLSNAGNAVLDLASFNGIGVLGDMASALSVFSPHLNNIGEHSGFLGFTNDIGVPYLINKYTRAAADDPTEEGRPLCQIRTVNLVGGYMKALHGDMEIAGATATELDEIREYLEGGFYYE